MSVGLDVQDSELAMSPLLSTKGQAPSSPVMVMQKHKLMPKDKNKLSITKKGIEA